MLKSGIVFLIFLKCILTQNAAEKDKKICRQLAKFVPNLCQIDIANKRCKEQCGESGTDNALDCGVKLIDDTRRKKKARMNTKENSFKRIVNGAVTEEGEWPWQVLVRNKNYMCGGAILSEYFVLTAAHCKMRPLAVFVGEHDRYVTKANEKVHQIKKIFQHESYKNFTRVPYKKWFLRQNYPHDIAIIQLREPISLEDENKARLCLPDNDHPIDELQECYVTGWGATSYKGFDSQKLREVKVLRVPRRICNLRSSYNGQVHESSLCAGYIDGVADACGGDSGGPLSCKNSDTDLWYSTGIVSWGKECARPNYYGVYADTLYHKEWIVKTLLDKSFPLERRFRNRKG